MAAHVISRASEAARHPFSTAAQAVGVARGIVASAIRIASGGPAEDVTGAPSSSPVAAQRVLPTDPGFGAPPRPAAPQRAPEPPHESYATEPSAVSRDSAHSRGGADEQVDDWYAAADEPDDGPTGIVEILEAHDPGEPPRD